MTKLNHKSKPKVEPSTRDSISSWLDVLTSMLAVSESQRLQIRDELEDHLRSRVDDLLIVGKFEPEAIQIAVAELGETAELAKLITHAHTRINPRRKIMNTALIAVALAGMSYGGFTFFNGTGVPSATPSNGGAVPVVVSSQTEVGREDSHLFNIEDAMIAQALQVIAEAFDQDLSVSRSLKQYYQQPDFHFDRFNLQGEYSLEQAVKQLRRLSEAALLDHVILQEGGMISLMTESEFMRKQIETRIYPNVMSSTRQNQRTRQNLRSQPRSSSVLSYTSSISSLLNAKYDSRNISIEVIENSMIVSARPEVHEEIIRLTQELQEIRDDLTDEQDRIAEEELQDRLAVTERINQEVHGLREDLLSAYSELIPIESLIDEMMMDQEISEDDSARTEHRVRLNDLMQRKKELAFRIEELESKYEYLSKVLLKSQYASLFEGLE